MRFVDLFIDGSLDLDLDLCMTQLSRGVASGGYQWARCAAVHAHAWVQGGYSAGCGHYGDPPGRPSLRSVSEAFPPSLPACCVHEVKQSAHIHTHTRMHAVCLPNGGHGTPQP